MQNNNFEQEVARAKYEGLHIQEGDILLINISAFDETAARPFNLSTLSQTGKPEGSSGGSASVADEYTVNAEGMISFPVLGNIYCRNLTKEQLKTDIANRLKIYLTDPVINITLKNFSISVLGDVGSPGQKTSTSEKLNIFQAIALSGDLQQSANRTNVKILRYNENEGKDKMVSVDLSDASIVNSPYYYLQQNDIVYVEPDRNKQIEANTTNPNRNLFLQLGGVALGLITLVISLTR
ncbi:polysaccharide biosynthesis/export family protein [Halpernia frigidisoli]|uniref:Polysaccharide export outer membrane protein n=1 Tax=Halpernia frigidisoli TaxID=1125876 RepID=A0A1I3FFS4_9FLAO|nr:polysaccharide biosynthesis/export family protein [Halpernia frigidisoli]SFI09771.1 polysaccharide export outer membrane protein [Halpernia frigidisoli]